MGQAAAEAAAAAVRAQAAAAETALTGQRSEGAPSDAELGTPTIVACAHTLWA